MFAAAEAAIHSYLTAGTAGLRLAQGHYYNMHSLNCSGCAGGRSHGGGGGGGNAKCAT